MVACIWLTWQEVREWISLRLQEIDLKKHSILTNLFQLWEMSLLPLLRKTHTYLTEIVNSHNYSKIHLVRFKKLVFQLYSFLSLSCTIPMNSDNLGLFCFRRTGQDTNVCSHKSRE